MTESSFVPLMTASDPMTAGMLKGLLEAEDIPVYIVGELLLDEFAKSQAAFGNSGVELRVPRDRLEESEQILADYRAAGEELAQDGNGEEDGSL